MQMKLKKNLLFELKFKKLHPNPRCVQSKKQETGTFSTFLNIYDLIKLYFFKLSC